MSVGPPSVQSMCHKQYSDSRKVCAGQTQNAPGVRVRLTARGRDARAGSTQRAGSEDRRAGVVLVRGDLEDSSSAAMTDADAEHA